MVAMGIFNVQMAITMKECNLELRFLRAARRVCVKLMKYFKRF